VDCIQPRPGEVVVDPACGTGGFLLAARGYLKSQHDIDRAQKKHLRFEALHGVEIVPGVARLCAMNLYLHGIAPADGHAPPIKTDDALHDEPSVHADVVLTNPPFGKKSSITVVNEEGDTDRRTLTYNRSDFWTSTSNKQLNFVQHVKSLLKVYGRAAVVVPDNVLFEGGAAEKVRRELLKHCDVHTVLRLPTGIFYAQGVKAQRDLLRPQAQRQGSLDEDGLGLRRPDEQAVHPEDAPPGACRPGRVRGLLLARRPPQAQGHLVREVARRPLARLLVRRDRRPRQGEPRSLLAPRREDSANLPEPHVLAQEIADDLRSALEQIEDVLADLQRTPGFRRLDG